MKLNRYIYFYLLILISFLFIQCNNKTNWNENYREKEKSPFGTHIISNEVKDLFGHNDVVYLKKNVYDYIVDNYLEEDEGYANYISIKSYATRLNKETLEKLLTFVSAGNNAFISLNYFNDAIKETLEITTKNLDSIVYSPILLKELKGSLLLKNKELDKEYFFDRNIRRNYFSSYNKNTSIVLGTQLIDSLEQPNFIKVYHGKGAVYLHTQPIVFTNYFLLNGKEAYAENVLSYLPNRTILWDPQVKRSKYLNNKDENKASIFKFFWKHPSLKWALYVGFFGLLLFLTFNARRKQRAIPIITSLKNSTIEFTHTIANLYFKDENAKNAVDKKIKFFLEKIRTKYLIKTNNLNGSFIENLALKSGNNLNSTRYLINTIIFLNKKSECTQDELVRLNTLIENFLNQH